ncbi:hypothetical protein NMY22_g4952 [Coprinellus aureogranulatus]|nr:hypothetical protein NMY22_g4952 [Coprinellus aureogranulatus]
MVCKKCEKKLSKVAAPDPFTSSSSSIKDGSRKVGENKLLSRPGGSKNRYQARLLSLHLKRTLASCLMYSRIRTNAKIASSHARRIRQSIAMAVPIGKDSVQFAAKQY